MNPGDEVEAICDKMHAEATKQRARAFQHFALGVFWLGWALCAFIFAWKLWGLAP